WSAPDDGLIALAKKEIAQIGLIAQADVTDACVVRQPKAYPVYDEAYRENVATVRQDLEQLYPTLHMVGRNGMHKYNNQDHGMTITIAPGVTLTPAYLDRAAQDEMLVAVRAIIAAAPLYVPRMPRSDKPMSVRMTNCGPLGWVTDEARGYRYQETHPETGEPW